MKRLRIYDEARLDLLKETAYYEAARDGTGRKFLLAVEAVFERAQRSPQSGASAAANTRRLLVSGFPFSVVYRENADEVVVYAIVHGRRRPGYWTGRVPNDT